VKNPTFYIASEFFRLLNGNLVYDSTTIPVYSLESVPTESDNLFVVFSNAYLIEGKTKDSFMTKVNFQIDVINLLTGSERTIKKIESIVNQILTIIIPTPTQTAIQSNSDYKIIKTELPQSRDFNNRNDTNLVLRKVLSFEISLKQIS
jgi:hypothetical protein